jgi:hypothetical protein
MVRKDFISPGGKKVRKTNGTETAESERVP